MENIPVQDSAHGQNSNGCLRSALLIGGAFAVLTALLLMLKLLIL